eukprot:TRINITY_DN4950_c0_g3_i1.p2 TRINITY_DN4950_c0_g3~~TRINITY_DN4950_c0_g3_i1.p2  ORF type:complete len:308 (+),score=66.15 TRINITY_DN4950_c0_g3_i1:278-1201(+)
MRANNLIKFAARFGEVVEGEGKTRFKVLLNSHKREAETYRKNLEQTINAKLDPTDYYFVFGFSLRDASKADSLRTKLEQAINKDWRAEPSYPFLDAIRRLAKHKEFAWDTSMNNSNLYLRVKVTEGLREYLIRSFNYLYYTGIGEMVTMQENKIEFSLKSGRDFKDFTKDEQNMESIGYGLAKNAQVDFKIEPDKFFLDKMGDIINTMNYKVRDEVPCVVLTMLQNCDLQFTFANEQTIPRQVRQFFFNDLLSIDESNVLHESDKKLMLEILELVQDEFRVHVVYQNDFYVDIETLRKARPFFSSLR